MKPQIISIDGKDFNVTVTPVHADRGLDVTEVFTLLPLAMIAANDINKQLTLLKEGQNAAVSVANCANTCLVCYRSSRREWSSYCRCKQDTRLCESYCHNGNANRRRSSTRH